jgi:ubiquinone/menaquinone biosynthesis C-methylase UbiE
MSIEAPTVDYEAIKDKQRATWASGDYAVIGTTLQLVGEHLCEALDVEAGWRVLDVAAGNGNVSLAAARRGCRVTASDYVPALLEGARARAAAEGLHIETEVADAEALPFDDASFDAVVSTFGVMFTPNQEQAAAELLRVCRPGGTIGLANWTPAGFVGQMFKVVGGYVTPPAGIRPPLQWGTEDRLAELLGSDATVEVTRREFVFRYRSPEEWVQTFLTYYGPTFKALGSLEGDAKRAFEHDLLMLAETANTSATSLRIPSEYLEVVATKTA